ncbi:hypothetical protein [Cytobacillus praedii]|nr:hypothetical protein [Cytobacillus praedii]
MFLLVLAAAARFLTFQYQEEVSMPEPENQHKEYEFACTEY